MSRHTVNKAVMRNVPLAELEKLFRIFEELACRVDWSLENGELIVSIGDTFELELTADPQELIDHEADKYWADDAMRIADGLWNE